MTARVTYPETHPLEGQPIQEQDTLIAWGTNADLQTKLTRLGDGDPYMPSTRPAGQLWEREAERSPFDPETGEMSPRMSYITFTRQRGTY